MVDLKFAACKVGGSIIIIIESSLKYLLLQKEKVGDAGDRTRGLIHAKHALYH